MHTYIHQHRNRLWWGLVWTGHRHLAIVHSRRLEAAGIQVAYWQASKMLIPADCLKNTRNLLLLGIWDFLSGFDRSSRPHWRHDKWLLIDGRKPFGYRIIRKLMLVFVTQSALTRTNSDEKCKGGEKNKKAKIKKG